MSERGATDFRERARVEADRYGPDPWIFVRELLQNARDAGATRVVIEVEERGLFTRIRCRDDGEGMSYEHARRYLFSLYASSKEDQANQVGRFGVGFWSILRFDPSRIVIRSCPRASGEGGAWEVILDGELQTAERVALEMSRGTEIILERPRSDGADHRRVHEAAYQNARFLCLRDQPETPLPITINGVMINAPFALGPPSSAFRRGQVHGVVGLGSAPRVELFSRGLRVRAAACLEDLLTHTGHTGHSRVRFPELPGGLAPQALLESDGLELLLSRSDARDNRSLRRLVRLGQEELRALVEQQLAQIRPPGLVEHFFGVVRRLSGESMWWRVMLAAAIGGLLALLLAQLLWSSAHDMGQLLGQLGVDRSVPSDRTRYTDLRKRYHGPQVSTLDPQAAEPLSLFYDPAYAQPYFAALIIEDVTGDAGTTAPVTSEPYPSAPCTVACVTVKLPIGGSNELPLPIPTGHRLDIDSLEFEPSVISDWLPNMGVTGTKRVHLSRAGEAVLILDWPVTGQLRYRTGPGPAISIPARSDQALPKELYDRAFALRTEPPAERVTKSIDIVREFVRYDVSKAVEDEHEQAVRAGQDFITRTLTVGAGDCDVQNGLLVAVLHAADIDARLAVGWVGRGGAVSNWLHAWAEYLSPDGNWRVADATARTAASGTNVAGLPTAGREVATATRPQPGERARARPVDSPGLQPGPRPPARMGIPKPIGMDDAASEQEPLRLVDRLLPTLFALVAHPWFPWVTLGLGSLGFGFGLLRLILVGRTARQVSLDQGGDLSGLLRGALAQPGAFKHLPALSYRRLIPLRGGSAISLNRARTLASEGRLYVGREPNELSGGARRRGLVVLDGDTAEGRTVAASLGATDLDRWGRRLERSTVVPVLGLVAAYLREHNERWRCVALLGFGDDIATLNLRPLGSRRRLGDRLVVITATEPVLLEADQMCKLRPQAATFVILDYMLERLDIGSVRRAQLLAPLGARAVAEAVVGGVAVEFAVKGSAPEVEPEV